MNGIHDMGGMQGMGELGYEESEPMFHETWEGRVHALAMAVGLGGSRRRIESIPAADYLRMSYYERWLHALVERIIDDGVVTRVEVENGQMDTASATMAPRVTVEAARTLPFRARQTEQDVDLPQRFQIGEPVRGRNMNPTTHTRMPRYTRGKIGVVLRNRGVFALPDGPVDAAEGTLQHVYLVRFTARELWGEDAPARDSVSIDMWDEYLEPA